MDPIKYTLRLQRIMLLGAAVSFVAGSVIITSLDPYQYGWAVWLLMVLLLICLTSLMTLLSFWWVFSIQKDILTIAEVNRIGYQSLIAAALTVFVLVLQLTDQLSMWLLLLVILMYAGYQLWLRD